MSTEEKDLGDGVLCALDSGMLRLRVRRDHQSLPDHIIHLDPETLDALNAYAVEIGFPIKPVEPHK